MNALKKLLAKIKKLFLLNDVHYINGPETLPPPLSKKEEEKLLADILIGNGNDVEKARQALITHNLRLVVYIAKKFENSGVPVEDLISIGTIGLIKSVNTFRPEKNIKLATYSSRCIENEILMYLRKCSAQKTEVSIDEPLNTDWDGNELLLSDVLDTDGDGNSLSLIDILSEDNDMDEQLQANEISLELQRCIDNVLDAREAVIIRLRYAIGGGEALTQRETAQRCGISRSYVSRIEKKAIEKLRAALQADGY